MVTLLRSQKLFIKHFSITELIGDEKGVVDLVSDDENENNQIPPPSKKPKVSSTLPLPLPKPQRFQNFGTSSGKNKLLSTTSKVCILKKSTQQPPKETPVVEEIDIDEAEPLVHVDNDKGPDEPLDEGNTSSKFDTIVCETQCGNYRN